eukprot:1195977-Prorocentrum_minimum.AAC.2
MRGRFSSPRVYGRNISRREKSTRTIGRGCRRRDHLLVALTQVGHGADRVGGCCRGWNHPLATLVHAGHGADRLGVSRSEWTHPLATLVHAGQGADRVALYEGFDIFDGGARRDARRAAAPTALVRPFAVTVESGTTSRVTPY